MDAIFEFYDYTKNNDKPIQSYTGNIETCKSIISELISDTSKTYVIKISVAEKEREE